MAVVTCSALRLLLVAVLVACAHGRSCNFTNANSSTWTGSLHTCLEAMKSPAMMYKVIAASALVPDTVGQYYACQNGAFFFEKTHLCVLDDLLASQKGSLQLVQGMCVPMICSPQDVSDLWFYLRCVGADVGPLMDKYIYPIWNATCKSFDYNATLCQKNYKEVKIGIETLAYASSYVSDVDVHCGDNEVTEWEDGTVGMLTVCAFIGFIILANELIEWRESNKAHGESEPLLHPNDGDNRTINGSVQEEPRPKKKDSLPRAMLRSFSIRNNIQLLFKKEASRSLG